jgi:hypothetical protein
MCFALRSARGKRSQDKVLNRIGGSAMEDYPQQKYALLTVIAVEESYIEVTDASGVSHGKRRRYDRATSSSSTRRFLRRALP